jgi:type VI protein secretion system component Hcp
MTNVLISSIGDDTLGLIPELTISFQFAQLKIEYDGARNADGTAAPATSESFNVANNTGPASAATPLQFVVGATSDLPKGFEAASTFRAPSESNTTSIAAGGAGAGKANFSDASVTIPIDASALAMLADEFTGRVLPTATVQLDTPNADGLPALFGVYGFKMVVLDGMTFTGTTATVSFAATSFSWMQGGDSATF